MRQAAWIGAGLIVVSGSDDRTEPGSAGPVQSTSPFGLRIVDTTGWTVWTLDTTAFSFSQTGEFLVALRDEPWTIAVYTPSRLVFRRALTPGSRLDTAGGRIYVTLGNEYRRHRVRVVEARTGTVLGTSSTPGWLFPLNRKSPASCWC